MYYKKNQMNLYKMKKKKNKNYNLLKVYMINKYKEWNN